MGCQPRGGKKRHAWRPLTDWPRRMVLRQAMISRRAVCTWAALACIMLVGSAARLACWSHVFTPQGVRFQADYDPHYHVLRAQRTIEDYPHVPWVDPNMNFPFGASIIWPPLFDQVIATSAVAVGGGKPPQSLTATVAAWVPVIIGVLTLPLVALLGAVLLGGSAGIGAAFLVALLPAHVDYSVIGRPDQHVAEVLLCCAIYLSFVAGWRRAPSRQDRSWCWSTMLALCILLAFWNWMGSGLYLAHIALFVATWHVLAPPNDPISCRMAAVLMAGGTLGSGLLIGSVLLFGAPGALPSVELAGVTGFHALLSCLTAAFAGLLWCLQRWRPPQAGRRWRLAEVAVAGIVPAVVVGLLSFEFRSAVVQGLTALGAADPWYADIQEFYPLLFGGKEPLSVGLRRIINTYGLGLLIMPVGAVSLLHAWREQPDERPALCFVLVWGALFLVLAAARRRFAPYLAVPMALWISQALRYIGNVTAHQLGAERRNAFYTMVWLVGAIVVLAPATPHLTNRARHVLPWEADLLPMLRWLRTAVPSVTDRQAVLAKWSLGHAIQYFARRPVITSPFGTQGGAGAMSDAAAFFFASDPAQAEEVLRARRVGFVLLANPRDEIYGTFGFAPAGTPPPLIVRHHWLHGERVQLTPSFMDLVPIRLFLFDGMWSMRSSDGVALGAYRLLYESPLHRRNHRVNDEQFKLFGVVAGARVRVSSVRPSATVVAGTSLATNQGRVVVWKTSGRADASGKVTLRLPYATGSNGKVIAHPYVVADDERRRTLYVDAAAVEHGTMVDLDLDQAER